MVLKLVLHENYPLILMGLAANFMFFSFHGLIFVKPARQQAFSKENLEQHQKTHQKTNGPESKIAGGGQPDQG